MARRLEIVLRGAVVLGLLLVVGLVQVEAAEWRDVLNKLSERLAILPSGCRLWVEDYSSGGVVNYKVWQRCLQWGTNGTKSTHVLTEFPTVITVPTDHPLQTTYYKFLCNNTNQQTTVAPGESIQGGSSFTYHSGTGTYWADGTCTGVSRNDTIDCVGNLTTGSGTSGTCGFGVASQCYQGVNVNGAVNCAAMDGLVQDYPNLDVTTHPCTTVFIGALSGTGTRTHSCHCIPRGYTEPALYNAEANICTSKRIVGDPAYPAGYGGQPGGAGGVDSTQGTPRVQGEPGSGGAGAQQIQGTGEGGAVTVQGTSSGGGITVGGTGTGGSVVVSGSGTGGSVTVGGTGTGGAVKVEGTGTAGAVKTTTAEDITTDVNAAPAVNPPSGPTFDPALGPGDTPEQEDIEDLLSSWLSTNPLVAVITGSGIQTNSSACSTSGEVYGSSFTISFCSTEIQNMLQLLGAVIYTIAGLYSIFVAFNVR